MAIIVLGISLFGARGRKDEKLGLNSALGLHINRDDFIFYQFHCT
jgi:hypothetical protein